MLNLDQVRLLENRVEKAVEKIQSLTAENVHLRAQLSGLQTRVNELEGLVRSFKDDQGRIEEGILNALEKLSAFEDSVFHDDTPAAPTTGIPTPVSVPPETPVATLSEETIPTSGETAEQIAIEAEWQDDTPKTSSDGQMDIF